VLRSFAPVYWFFCQVVWVVSVLRQGTSAKGAGKELIGTTTCGLPTQVKNGRRPLANSGPHIFTPGSISVQVENPDTGFLHQGAAGFTP